MKRNSQYKRLKKQKKILCKVFNIWFVAHNNVLHNLDNWLLTMLYKFGKTPLRILLNIARSGFMPGKTKISLISVYIVKSNVKTHNKSWGWSVGCPLLYKHQQIITPLWDPIMFKFKFYYIKHEQLI